MFSKSMQIYKHIFEIGFRFLEMVFVPDKGLLCRENWEMQVRSLLPLLNCSAVMSEVKQGVVFEIFLLCQIVSSTHYQYTSVAINL